MNKKKWLCLLFVCFGGIQGAFAGNVIPYADGENASRSEVDSTFVSRERNYNRFLFLKINKGRGYRKQGFEQPDAYALLEKGVGYFSFNVNFRGNDADNQWLEPVAILDHLYNRNIGANLSGGYLFKHNMAVGIKATYQYSETRLKVNADILSIIIDAENFEANNAKSTWSVGVLLKNFIPLDYGQRFFLTNETGLSYYYTSGLSKNYYDNGLKIHKIEKDQYGLSVGITPGLMYFMTEGFAFEFSMSPVIAYYEHTKLKNNQVESGSASNYGLNFKFMPLNIQFGFAYYFGLDYYKNREHVKNRYRNSIEP